MNVTPGKQCKEAATISVGITVQVDSKPVKKAASNGDWYQFPLTVQWYGLYFAYNDNTEAAMALPNLVWRKNCAGDPSVEPEIGLDPGFAPTINELPLVAFVDTALFGGSNAPALHLGLEDLIPGASYRFRVEPLVEAPSPGSISR